MTPPLRFRNYSMWTTKKYDDDWYEWVVFVDEPRDVIDQIDSIEYELHKTFPDPLRVSRDREHKFCLVSSGWGEFTIKVRVSFQDGSLGRYTHHLTLEPDDWPRKSAPTLSGGDEQRVYSALFDEKHRWRKFPTIVKRTGLSPQRVSEVLASLEAADLVRRGPERSIDDAELWAATSVVGVLPKAI